MPATSRDRSTFRQRPANASVTPDTDGDGTPGERCCNTSPLEQTPSDDPLGIVAALCRMALLRRTAHAVNGAYQQDPLSILSESAVAPDA